VENRTKAEDEIKNGEQHEALKQTVCAAGTLTGPDLPFIDSRLASGTDSSNPVPSSGESPKQPSSKGCTGCCSE
jgi:hypothetical protein